MSKASALYTLAHSLLLKEAAVLSSGDRQQLPSSDFAVPQKAPESGSYPIPDESHARDALARASGKPVDAQVRLAVKRKFPGIQEKAAFDLADHSVQPMSNSSVPQPVATQEETTPGKPTETEVSVTVKRKSPNPNDTEKRATAVPALVGAAYGADKGHSEGHPGTGALAGATGAHIGSSIGHAAGRHHGLAGVLAGNLIGGIAGYKAMTHGMGQTAPAEEKKASALYTLGRTLLLKQASPEFPMAQHPPLQAPTIQSGDSPPMMRTHLNPNVVRTEPQVPAPGPVAPARQAFHTEDPYSEPGSRARGTTPASPELQEPKPPMLWAGQ